MVKILCRTLYIYDLTRHKKFHDKILKNERDTELFIFDKITQFWEITLDLGSFSTLRSCLEVLNLSDWPGYGLKLNIRPKKEFTKGSLVQKYNQWYLEKFYVEGLEGYYPFFIMSKIFPNYWIWTVDGRWCMYLFGWTHLASPKSRQYGTQLHGPLYIRNSLHY